MRPSFLGLIASGILILVSFIMFVINYRKIDSDDMVMILLLFGIAISVHSIQHALEEIYFRFNPLIGQWNPQDKPACPCGVSCKCMESKK